MSEANEKTIVAPVIIFGAAVGASLVEAAPPAEPVRDPLSYPDQTLTAERIAKDDRTLLNFVLLMRRTEDNPFRTSNNVML